MEVLRLGDTGSLVSMLQLALIRSGFLQPPADGVFGMQTENALRRFQSANGMRVDGIAGPLTWKKLNPYLVGYETYTIRPGDTLYGISRRFGATVQAIEVANPSVMADSLRVGQRIIIPFNFRLVPTDIAYCSYLVEFIIEGLTARYPFLWSGSVGKSVMGKDIGYIGIGSGKKQVMYNAAHHANEWITTPVVLKFVEDYSIAYINDAMLTTEKAMDLYALASVYIVPMVNPDGVDLVTGALNKKSPHYDRAVQISRDYPQIAFPDGWKANIIGTDTNLNYPASWEEAKEYKYSLGFTSPAPRDFVGTAPLSIPESRAMTDFTKGKNFSLVIAYHTQGEVIFWKYLDYEPEHAFSIAKAFGEASGYEVQENPREAAYAGYKDWFIKEYNRPGYTVEVGRGVNPLPLSQFKEIYDDNLGIMVLGITISPVFE